MNNKIFSSAGDLSGHQSVPRAVRKDEFTKMVNSLSDKDFLLLSSVVEARRDRKMKDSLISLVYQIPEDIWKKQLGESFPRLQVLCEIRDHFKISLYEALILTRLRINEDAAGETKSSLMSPEKFQEKG